MELIVITSRHAKQPEREKIVMQAVIEVAETTGIPRIIKRKGNVYCTGVYVNYGNRKLLLYNDWEKKWNTRMVSDNIMSSIHFSPALDKDHQIIITIA